MRRSTKPLLLWVTPKRRLRRSTWRLATGRRLDAWTEAAAKGKVDWEKTAARYTAPTNSPLPRMRKCSAQ